MERGRTAGRSLPWSLDGRECAEKRMPRGPGMGRWPHAFPTQMAALLGTGHIQKLGWWSKLFLRIPARWSGR